MGNICRSPAAEGALVREVRERGLEEYVEVDSAGTISYHAGDPPDERMRRAARNRGMELNSLARPARVEDFQEFDLIVAMDRENRADLEELAGASTAGGRRAELRLLSHFLPPGASVDVPDPYYGGAVGFETVLDMVEEAAAAILEHLLDGERSPGAAS